MSWNNGNMYADHDGNIYTYNQSSGAQKYNTSTGSYQAASKPATSSSYANNQYAYADKPAAAQSTWADRAGAAQYTGEQRFSGWSSAGGGGWGGARGGGWRR
jgi:hypothetical protein